MDSFAADSSPPLFAYLFSPQDEAARKFHLPADMGQWDGEGKGALSAVCGWAACGQHGRSGGQREQPVDGEEHWPGRGHYVGSWACHSARDSGELILSPPNSPPNSPPPDYNMKDVQAFHEVQARAAANPDVFNGEGPGEHAVVCGPALVGRPPALTDGRGGGSGWHVNRREAADGCTACDRLNM